MIFYDSKHISSRLNINTAKWKRWARTFLAPDPLGGLQSGVARQFSLKDAFKVYLGGYLVGELKFSIPDAGQVLRDLSGWLKANGYYSINPQSRDGADMRTHQIYLFQLPNRRFGYCTRTILSSSATAHAKQETFIEAWISIDRDPLATGEAKSAYFLAVSSLYKDFLNRIE